MTKKTLTEFQKWKRLMKRLENKLNKEKEVIRNESNISEHGM